MVDQVLQVIASQVPDLVALLLIIVLFIRYMEKRDLLLIGLTREIRSLSNELAEHAIETTAAIEEMHRVNKIISKAKPRAI